MPGAIIGNATRAWVAGANWSLYSQCAVWDPKTRCVHIFECVREHNSTDGTQPPNTNYWRFIARR